MRLKEYGRNPQKRKAYVQQPDLLLVGVDVSNAKHNACMGTQTAMTCRTLACTHTREGFRRFAQTLRDHVGHQQCRRLLIAMAPSGLSWPALYARLKSCGYGVCLVHCQAGRTKRQTMPEGTSKTDEKDAYRVFDLLLQGTFFLPVARDPELQAAYRLMRRPLALQKRVRQLRQQLRAAIHLALPALTALVQALTPPTALRFLPTHPTPEAILRNGRPRFLEQWQPRRRWGPWRPETFHRLYDLAKASLGLQDAYRLDAFEMKIRAGALVEALTQQQLWLDKAIARLAPRADYQRLLQFPRIGQPTAAAILPALGDSHEYHNGQQLVQLAGLDIRLCASGSSIRQLPTISHVGSA